ncbi:MAG TPA: hypothetical protein VJC37_08700 [Planctomycetota bacterium]|nr:hypothetical protein [Planctomycetota bacterium]
MNNVAAYDRVKSFLETSQDLTVTPPREIKEDLNFLVSKLERLRAKFPKLKDVDLSDHIRLLL